MHLTANEYRLVELLSRSAGKVLTYDRISEAMWGDAAGGNSQLLRVNMANIRRKLEQNPAEPAVYPHRDRCGLPHEGAGADL